MRMMMHRNEGCKMNHRIGNYYAQNGRLIGHDAADVMGWVAAHSYTGTIWFNYGDDSDDIDVTDIFMGGGCVMTTQLDVIRAARINGYTIAMVDAIWVVREALGATDVSLKACVELHKLARAAETRVGQ